MPGMLARLGTLRTKHSSLLPILACSYWGENQICLSLPYSPRCHTILLCYLHILTYDTPQSSTHDQAQRAGASVVKLGWRKAPRQHQQRQQRCNLHQDCVHRPTPGRFLSLLRRDITRFILPLECCFLIVHGWQEAEFGRPAAQICKLVGVCRLPLHWEDVAHDKVHQTAIIRLHSGDESRSIEGRLHPRFALLLVSLKHRRDCRSSWPLSWFHGLVQTHDLVQQDHHTFHRTIRAECKIWRYLRTVLAATLTSNRAGDVPYEPSLHRVQCVRSANARRCLLRDLDANSQHEVS